MYRKIDEPIASAPQFECQQRNENCFDSIDIQDVSKPTEESPRYFGGWKE